jgi:predicted transposase/invertase (TIGR01784 family)
LVVLDVLAVDEQGRRFNIEMQTRFPLAMPKRMLLYNCLNYFRQLREGSGYTLLNPAISICILERRLFNLTEEKPLCHRSFRLRCDQATDMIFTDDFEFHTFELPHFRPSKDNVKELPNDEKWLYLLKYAQSWDAKELSDLLMDGPYREALGVLEMISKSPEDFQYYESRLKFLRDEEAKLQAATQEGIEKGMEKGMETGTLVGTIQTLQELLGDPVTAGEELRAQELNLLSGMIIELKGRLRHRGS